MKRAPLVVFFALGTVVALACGFPSVTFTDMPQGGDETGVDSAVPETSIVEDASDAQDAPSDVRPDILIIGDAGTDVDGGNPCDRDQDGYIAKGGNCGGNDCDDFDGRAHPNLTGFFTFSIIPPTNGDWDCSGVVQKQFPVKQACGALSLGACAQNLGFTGEPACGTQATYITACNVSGLTCVAATKSEYQGCL